jgi:hypothetical protein
MTMNFSIVWLCFASSHCRGTFASTLFYSIYGKIIQNSIKSIDSHCAKRKDEQRQQPSVSLEEELPLGQPRLT